MIRSRLGSLVLLAIVNLALLPVGSSASAGDDPPGTTSLDARIVEKRRHYGEQFPEILFITLKGGKTWVHDMTAVTVLLGNRPASLDYEHPPEAREALMAVTLDRLELMLRNRVPSASLLRADDPHGWPKNICVITLDPCVVATKEGQTLVPLLDLSQQQQAQVSPEIMQQCGDYLDFAFDHEAFHCLSSFYTGPQPRSFKPLWAEYWHHREENGADAFSIAMHLKKHGRVTQFARDIQRLRGLALYDADIDHWTCRAIETALQGDKARFGNSSVKDIFEYATRVRDELVPDYDAYLAYRASAMAAMSQIGVPETITAELEEGPDNVEPDPQLIDDLLRYANACQQKALDRPMTDGPPPKLFIQTD